MRPSLRHRLFQWAVALKGIDGMLEIAGGVLLLIFGAHGVMGVVAFLTQHELAEDPRDALAGYLVRHTADLAVGSIHFAAAYLLVHGVAKVGIAAGLLRKKRWVFPPALAFLGLFLAYQVYRVLISPSPGFVFLTVVDAAILVLVWREYVATAPSPAGENGG